MPVTPEQVVEALRPVQDPELHRSIVELDMVRDVRVEGGVVSVLIALTVAGCPLRAEITSRVTGAVGPLEGVERVDVDMTVMTPAELESVRAKMQASGGQGHGHEPAGATQAMVPFAAPGSPTRVLGITSGKGGVGKSSITVNLAVALARLGHDVAILDADVYGFSVPAMLGIEEPPHVVGEMIVPPESNGVRCISLGFFVDEDKPVMWRGPMLEKALRQFLTDVVWGEPDFLLIDMPPGTGDVAMSMAKFLPAAEIYVVTTPQSAAERVAQRSASMARHIDLPLAGVIENMSWFSGDDAKRYEIFGSGGGQELADTFQIPLLAQIPLVPELRVGGDVGSPIAATGSETEAGYAFEQLARAVEKFGRRRVYREELKVR